MNKQTILIYDFDTLFDILIEIRQNFKFDILKAKNKKGLVGEIQHRENLGSDVYLHLILNGGKEKIIVRSDPSKALDTKIGDEIKMGWLDEKGLAVEIEGQSIAMSTKAR